MANRDNGLEALTAQASALAATVNRLNEDVGAQVVKLTQTARTNRRLIRGLAVSIILDVILTLVLAFGLNSIHHNANDIQRVTARLNIAQTVQRQKALCPLYQLFLDSESPRARAASPNGPAAYDSAFKVIHEGYNALSCKEFIKKGR